MGKRTVEFISKGLIPLGPKKIFEHYVFMECNIDVYSTILIAQ
jgi:hypothetical protein